MILGIVQSVFGTLRFYNASEQDYEHIKTQKIYTIEKNTPIPTSLPIKTEIPKDALFYASENTNTTENIPKNTLPENTQKIEEQIHIIEQKNEKNTPPKIITNTTTPKQPVISITPKPTIERHPITPIVVKTTIVKKQVSPIVISTIPKQASSPKGYTETISSVVTGKYFRDALWKFPIIIDTERLEPRGQMYNESITLSSNMASLPEVSKVLVHEIGHMIDIYALKGSSWKTDPSEEFYKISWENTSTIRAWVSQSSFISGYASTNQYEDFAESFAMYVFHNNDFLNRTKQDDILKQKYNFLHSHIFWNAFIGSSYEKNPIPKKIWDVTKIAIRWNNISTVFAWLQWQKSYWS